MIRPVAIALLATLALLTAPASGAGETFPLIHNEPITVRVLNGKDGQPLAHLHLTLFAGYDPRDIHDRLWQQETLTDEQGRVQLSSQLRNLPWLQVLVSKLCQANSRQASFSVERIRRDGLSAPNRCGVVTVQDTPGVLTVFVKGKTRGSDAKISANAHKTPEATNPVPRYAHTEIVKPSPQLLPIPLAAIPTTAPVPVKVASQSTWPQEAEFSVSKKFSAEKFVVSPAESGRHRRVALHSKRQSPAKRTAHQSNHVLPRPVLATCQAQPPANPHPVTKTTLPAEAKSPAAAPTGTKR
jgi:hypothetical protein